MRDEDIAGPAHEQRLQSSPETFGSSGWAGRISFPIRNWMDT